jgi:hypothetical protein
LRLLKVQEFWLLYAGTLDQLEREDDLFLHGVGHYRIEGDTDSKKKEEAFIKNLEDIIISKGRRYVALSSQGGDGGGGQNEGHINKKEDDR